MSLLIAEPPLTVQPTLIRVLGLKKAILVQQVQYWLSKSNHRKEGKVWVYNTYDAWIEQLPFYRRSTLAKDIADLEKDGILISTSKYNKMKYDRTKWYTLNYAKLEELTIVQKLDYPSSNNETINSPETNHSNHRLATETSHETTCEVSTILAEETKTTLKSGAKKHKPKATGSVLDIAAQFEKEEPMPKIESSATSVWKFWKWVLVSKYGYRHIPNLTAKERGMLNMLVKRLYPNALKCIEVCLLDWASFSSYVLSTSGGYNSPKVPSIGYFLKHVQEAMAFVDTAEAWEDMTKSDKVVASLDKPKQKKDTSVKEKPITLDEILAMESEDD